ncbi:MAG: MmcQ/YjbR family DNA-binding protein [Bryobacteraceae bacterium]
MPKRKIDFETVRTIALELPDVEDASAYGSLAVKVRGKLMACMAINKSAEPGSLGVRMDFDQRAELVATAPDVYYFTDHYANYPMVLVRLSQIHPDALRDLLGAAWRFVTAKTPGVKRPVQKLPRRMR